MHRLFLSVILFYVHGINAQDADTIALSIAYEEKNPHKILELLEDVKPSMLSDSLLAKYFLTKGIAYGKLGVEDTALYYINNCLDLSSANKYSYLSARAGNAKGLIFFHSGKYEDAIKSYQNGLAIAEQFQYKEEESTILGNMGGVYFQMSDYSSAIKYSIKSLNIANDLNDIDDMAYGHLRLAVVFEKIDSLEQSIFHNSQASKYAETLENYVLLTYIEKTLGNIHKKLNRLDSSLYHHKRAREFAVLEGEQENIASTAIEIARVYLKMNKLDLAEMEVSGVLDFSTKNGYPRQAKLAHEVLYHIAMERGDFKKALNERNEYILVHDSLNAVETRERIAELEIKYETTKKEKEIIEANAEIERKERFQAFLYIIIGTIILFSVIAIFLLIQRFRLKKALLFQEIDTLRVQINSVFGGGTQKLNLTIEEINEGLFKPLSEREFEILNEAISEKTNSEIAETVFVSVNTVKTHLKNIYTKLGVSNRKEALEVLLAKTPSVNN